MPHRAASPIHRPVSPVSPVGTAGVFSPYIVSWIAGTDEQYIVDLASKYMRVNTPFYFVLAVLIVLRSSLQAIP